MAIDKKITRSVNIKFPLERSSQGAFKTNETTVDAIADDLKMLLMTNYGERVNQYYYGANLRSLLFENIDDDLKQQVADRVYTAIQKWIPYISLESVNVYDSDQDASLHTNELSVKIKFSVGKTDLSR